MLTKEDKEFLTENFATKAGLELVKNDIESLATKKELSGVKVDVANLQKDVRSSK